MSYGTAQLLELFGGSGGGGGSGWGGFEGIAGGGGGGGGALALLAGGTVTVGAKGWIRADGATGSRTRNSNGCGAGGAGGALLIEAPAVDLVTGGRVSALGSPTLGDGGSGGVGRIRVDAPSLELDGVAASATAFSNRAEPAAGWLGSATPSVSVATPASPATADVTVACTLTDADGSRVWLDLEVSVNGGAFGAARLSTASGPVFGLRTSPTGALTELVWDSAGDLGAGTFSVVLRARARSSVTGAWAQTSAFTVTN